jgi:hypothetical protein
MLRTWNWVGRRTFLRSVEEKSAVISIFSNKRFGFKLDFCCTPCFFDLSNLAPFRSGVVKIGLLKRRSKSRAVLGPSRPSFPETDFTPHQDSSISISSINTDLNLSNSMSSPCIKDSHSCRIKPPVGNGVICRDAASQVPRTIGVDFKLTLSAKTDRVDRPHIRSAGVRYSVMISEGYRHVTWYRLLFLVTISIMTVLAFVQAGDRNLGSIISSTCRKCLETFDHLGGFILQAIGMRRISSGFLASLALSPCGVIGTPSFENEGAVSQTYDVFDYIDPLIGTINGGGIFSFKIQSVADDGCRSCFSWCNPSLR